MVKKCCICGNRYEKGGSISIHAFPKDNVRRRAWEASCRLNKPIEPPTKQLLCSQHFTTNSFMPNREFGIKVLKPTAVPTLFSWTIEKEKRMEPEFEGIESCCSNMSNYNTSIHDVRDQRLCAVEEQEESSANEIIKEIMNITTNQVIENEEAGPFDSIEMNDIVKTPTKKCKVWRPARIGDLTEEHFSTPRRANRHLALVKKIAKEQSRKINMLKVQNKRLTVQVRNFKELLSQLQKNK